jgi:sigma-B regulation protein RsbU (phosphoserine phosphatase)
VLSLLLYLLIGLFHRGWLLSLLWLTTLIFGFAAFIRFSHAVVRGALWRVRDRLIAAYFFIAVVPLVLIITLIGLGVYLIAGQVAIFLVTSELDRSIRLLQGNVQFASRASPEVRVRWSKELAPLLARRFPGLEFVAAQEGRRWGWPEGVSFDIPAAVESSGIVVLEGRLYAFAHAGDETRWAAARFPLTTEFLAGLGRQLGPITILDLAPGTRQPLLAPENAAAIPPKQWIGDFLIYWFAPLPVVGTSGGGEPRSYFLTITTRPSAVFNALFINKVDLNTRVIPVLFFSTAILFLIAEGLALIAGISITRSITGAVHELYQGTLRVRAGDFSHRVKVSGHDQLAELAASFNQMTENLERLVAVEKERERLQADLAIAQEVQSQLYPRTVPELKTLRIAALCKPARMVSGDYYDYLVLGENLLAFAIGDVAGKGISAALLMAMLQSSVRTMLRSALQMSAAAGQGPVSVRVSTAALVRDINRHLHASTAPEKYATFFLGVYDDRSSELAYTNAGHLPPFLVRRGEVRTLDSNGMVIGAFPFASYEESRLILESGDLLVLYTDGITEAENEYGEMFGEERLKELVLRHANAENHQLMEAVISAVSSFTGSHEVQDDLTLLVLRRL